jgi:type 1 glutamine amidotransferase
VVAPVPDAGPAGTAVLVFSRTTGFRHASIPAAVTALRELGAANGIAVDATEDAGAFTTSSLRRYRAVVWASTSGDVLDDGQRAAFAGYLAAGGGYVGIHAAADTEYGWDWYGGLVGARFRSHPEPQTAVVRVEDRTHPATASLAAWTRFDEWYTYRTNPRPHVHVLATVDESTYDGGGMGADHPIAWCHRYGGGRAFYTGMGHTVESYAEPEMRAHLLGGILWAAGLAEAG